jgi:hypothetical protein
MVTGRKNQRQRTKKRGNKNSFSAEDVGNIAVLLVNFVYEIMSNFLLKMKLISFIIVIDF